MYLYVKWNSFDAVCWPAVKSFKHLLRPLATPRTEACDAVGGALRPKWRERPGRESYPSR